MNKDSNLTAFPELNLATLRRYATRWSKGYTQAIQSIVLYNYTPQRLAAYKEIMPGFAVRYALIFELLPDVDMEILKKLEIATEQGETIRRGYPVLFDNRFFTVYRDKPEEDFYKHWAIFLKKAGEGMPPGVIQDEPFWVLYDSEQTGGNKKQEEETASGSAKQRKEAILNSELFLELSPTQFTRRVREWIERWPLIDEIRLYAGKYDGNPYALVFITQDRMQLGASGFLTDSLLPLQQDLRTIHRDPRGFNLSEWQIFTINTGEELPLEFVHPQDGWYTFQEGDTDIQTQDDNVELADERVLWIIYPDTTREVWLNDCFGQQRLLSKQYFNSINRSVFAFLYKNAQQIITSTYFLEHGIDLKNKPLHKVVAELGFKGKLKKLFFDVSKSDILFRKSITRKELNEANVTDSKEELYQLFFK